MKALISPSESQFDSSGQLLGFRVATVSTVEFPVASPLFWTDCPVFVDETFSYLEGIFTAPAVPHKAVASVTAFQAKAALLQCGLLDSVEAQMNAANTEAFTRLAWYTAQEFKRDSPTVAAMIPALGITETQLDDLFKFASTITA